MGPLLAFWRGPLAGSVVAVALLAGCNHAPPPATEAAASAARPAVPGPDPGALTDSTAPAALLAYGRQYPASGAIIRTRLGTIRVKLYDDTPIHRANFALMARKGVFDESLFNRVVKNFAVEGGRSLARTIKVQRYRLPPEFRPQHFHQKGALAMARYSDEQNPKKLSSNVDFYFVVGEKLPPAKAQAIAGRTLTPAQLKVYETIGGTPSLDGQYTVFGEVTEGLDVVERMTNEPADKYEWPLKDIGMKVEILP